MGLSASPIPRCLPSTYLRAPYCTRSFSNAAFCSLYPSLTKLAISASDGVMFDGTSFRFPLWGSKRVKARNIQRACSYKFDESPREELVKQVEGLVEKFDLPDEDDDDLDIYEELEKYSHVTCAVSDGYRCRVLENGNNLGRNRSLPTQLSVVKVLEPSLLGIQPDPPEWPERNIIGRVRIERKANSVQVPLSLRIIQRKQQGLWQEGLKDTSDISNCSMKKAIASTVYGIQAIQSHAFYMRNSLYSGNLHGDLAKVQSETSISFVWLFEQVFCRTPNLMVDLIALLANFSIFSITENSAKVATPSSVIKEMLPFAEDKNNKAIPEKSESEDSQVKSCSVSTSVAYPDMKEKGTSETTFLGDNKLTAEELKLWISMVREAPRLAEEYGIGSLENDALNIFISPFSVKIEADNVEEYRQTDLAYQMSLFEDPNNSLLLSNYGQFLCLVGHDYDRAEKCFMRALLIDPEDSETLIRYADFLWIARKDEWGAEEKYLQAIAADPSNSHHASKYANFLWNTGGEDTCFPLSSDDEWQINTSS